MSINQGMENVQALLSRRSNKMVQAPAPSAEQLNLILQTATRAPDHAALRAWRFVIVQKQDIAKLTDLAIDSTRKSGREITPQKEQNMRKWLAEVPMLLGLAYQISHDNSKVPEIEQTLSMGAAVMNIQNAVHMLGFSSYWSTGLGTYTDEVPAALGLDTLDYRFVGFLAIGTPISPAAAAVRPDVMSMTHTWKP